MVLDWGGREWHETEKTIEHAKDRGFDSIIIKNAIDPYSRLEGIGKKYQKPSTQYIILDTSTIKTKSQLLAEYEKAKEKALADKQPVI